MNDPAEPQSMPVAEYLSKGGRLTSPQGVPPRYRAELLRLMSSFVDSELAGGPLPALAYRAEWRGRSAVISGNGWAEDALVDFAQGATAPAFRVTASLGTTSFGSTACCEPRPSHFGQAPNGLLKEKSFGEGSKNSMSG